VRHISIIIALLMAAALAMGFVACSDDSDEEENRVPPIDDDDDDGQQPTDDDDDDGDDEDDDDDDEDDDDNDDDDDDDFNDACEPDSEEHTITYATWDMLPVELQNVMIAALQSEFAAQDFFGRFVYWYGAIRELHRSLRDFYDPSFPGATWTEETAAASLAVGYIRFRVDFTNIAYLHNYLIDILDRIDSPVPPYTQPENYFLNHEAEIMADPYANLWFQFYWAREAFGADDQPRYDTRLSNMVCQSVNTGYEYSPTSLDVDFTNEQLPQAIAAALDADLGNWRLRLDPKLTIASGPVATMLQYE